MRLIPVIVSLGLIWVVGIGSFWVATPEEPVGFNDRVNLALRQVGHKLLNLEGDISSPIPPVEMKEPGHFRLKMEHAFNYDSLPYLLDQAFASYNITSDYHVVVERCGDDFPILGYNLQAFNQGDVPCVGREQDSECSNIVVTFAKPPLHPSGNNLLLAGLFVLTGITIGGMLLWKAKRRIPYQKSADMSASSPQTGDSPHIILGKFRFDHQNQVLQLGEERQELTFRESKLLYHLTQHINKVQTRDHLIEAVWADEGVLVGRSLDVFISRLRKLLQADENVSIRNIHGVGYRLEVGE